MTTADAVKIGDLLWGRTVSGITQDRGDTQIMFEFEDGGLVHLSQNRVLSDYRPKTDKNLADAISALEAYIQWAATGSDNWPRSHAADIRLVLKALAESQERSSDAGWQADYDRTMNPPRESEWL